MSLTLTYTIKPEEHGTSILNFLKKQEISKKAIVAKSIVEEIDNSDIIEDEYYEEDGIHFKANFYPIWAEKMAEVATL